MLKDSVRKLFNALESIGKAHEELYDTDVREQLAETLYFGFVWAHPMPSQPVTYGMFSAEGDAAVAKAVSVFLKEAIRLANEEHVGAGRPRHAALQNASILTRSGQSYENFIGHADQPFDIQRLPTSRFQGPEYDR